MWHWLRKKWAKKHEFIAKLFAVFFVAHCFILFMLFFVDSRENAQRIYVGQTLIDSDAKIVYCPLNKTMMQSTGGRAGSRGSTQSAGAAAQSREAAQDKKVAGSGKKPATALTNKPVKSGKAGKAGKNKKSDKADKKNKSKKDKQKKSEPLKPIKETKAPINTEKPKLPEPVVPEVATEKAVVETEVDVKAAQVSTAESTDLPATGAVSGVAGSEAWNGSGNEHIIYMGRDDMRNYQIVSQVQEAIEEHWTLPPGISEDIHCTVRMTIQSDGAVSAQIEEPSGMLMYDIAARDAVQASQMPQHIWGKSFLIVL